MSNLETDAMLISSFSTMAMENLHFLDTLQFTKIAQTGAVRVMTLSTTDDAIVLDPLTSEFKLNDLTIRNDSTKILLRSDKSQGIFVEDNTIFQNNVLIENDLTTLGNLTGNNLNIWTQSGFTGQDQVEIGYGFRVASNQVLELVKYSRFNNSNTVLKKVATFGSTVNSTDDLPDTDPYLVFDELKGISRSGGRGKAGLISSSDVSLTGTTTLAGDLLPSSSGAVNIGSMSGKIKNIFLANTSLIYFGNSKIGFDGSMFTFKNTYGGRAKIDAMIDANNIVGDLRTINTFPASSITSGVLDSARLPADISDISTLTVSNLVVKGSVIGLTLPDGSISTGSGGNIDAANVISGVFAPDRIPNDLSIAHSIITVSNLVVRGVLTADAIAVGDDITASAATNGTIDPNRIPSDLSSIDMMKFNSVTVLGELNADLDASYLFGTLDAAVIPTDLSVIPEITVSNLHVKGTLSADVMDASNITSGVLSSSVIPSNLVNIPVLSVSNLVVNGFLTSAGGLSIGSGNFSAADISSGVLDPARIPSNLTSIPTLTTSNLDVKGTLKRNGLVLPIGFHSYYFGNGTIIASTAEFKIPYQGTVFTTGPLAAAFNSTTNTFTCPETGYYTITLQFHIYSDNATTGSANVFIKLNGNRYHNSTAYESWQTIPANGETTLNWNDVVYLTQGDTLNGYASSTIECKTMRRSVFYGYLIS